MAGLKRDKTRPSRVPPLPMETRLKVITKGLLRNKRFSIYTRIASLAF